METDHRAEVTHAPSLQQFDNLQEWLEEYYLAKKVEGLSKNTLRIYKQSMTHFLNYCEGQVITSISQIEPATIRAFMLWLEENGSNPGGVHVDYRSLKTFLLWYELEAEPDNWRNPIRKVKAPKLAEDPLEPVETEDVRKMVDVCGLDFLGKRDKSIMLTLLDTGVRAGELLALNIDDLNHITGVVQVREGQGTSNIGQ